MEAARDHRQPLSFQGHDYQLFGDLAPSTIQKHRAIKSLLVTLQQCDIVYKLGFLFVLIFQYKGKRYAPKTPGELNNCLWDLNLGDNSSTIQQGSQAPHPQGYKKRDQTPSPQDQNASSQRCLRWASRSSSGSSAMA